jgi:hypothetical protein
MVLTAACGGPEPAPQSGEPAAQGGESLPSASETGAAPAEGEAVGVLSISGTDPCSLFTGAQVEAAFGGGVTEVKPQESFYGKDCIFELGEQAQFEVHLYEGEGGKRFFGSLITAATESCEKVIETFLTVAFSGLTGDLPPAEDALLAAPFPDLYRRYHESVRACWVVHSQDRADVGSNVVASQMVFLEGMVNLAALSDERIVEISYRAQLSPELEQAYQQVTNAEQAYAASDAYVRDVMSGTTEILIGLLKQAAGQ